MPSKAPVSLNDSWQSNQHSLLCLIHIPSTCKHSRVPGVRLFSSLLPEQGEPFPLERDLTPPAYTWCPTRPGGQQCCRGLQPKDGCGFQPGRAMAAHTASPQLLPATPEERCGRESAQPHEEAVDAFPPITACQGRHRARPAGSSR